MGVGKSDPFERRLVHVALGNELDQWTEEREFRDDPSVSRGQLFGKYS